MSPPNDLCRWIVLCVALASGCAAYPSRDDRALDAVETARAMIGRPYRFGGASPKGFDCSGLVHYAYGRAGIAVPRDTEALYARAHPIALADAEAGDLLFFRIEGGVSHVAIYLGDGRFVHAPSRGRSVENQSLASAYWKARFLRAGRL